MNRCHGAESRQVRARITKANYAFRWGEGRGRGCWQKASIIDILPRSTTVTDRRKFSPAQGPSLSERYLRREPSPPLSLSLSLSKQEDRPAEFCRGKNEIRGRWFDDHGMQPPWTVILQAGQGGEWRRAARKSRR